MRPVSIKLVGEAEEAYNKLNKIVGEQKAAGKENSDEIKIWNGIQRTFDRIQENPFYGENAKKNLIPKYYIDKYDAKNIFIIDLPFFWRMIYAIEGDKVEIFVFILDIFDHGAYNKRFGFRDH